MGGPPKRLKQHLRLQKLGFAPDKLGMILMARGLASSLAGRGANRHQSLGALEFTWLLHAFYSEVGLIP